MHCLVDCKSKINFLPWRMTNIAELQYREENNGYGRSCCVCVVLVKTICYTTERFLWKLSRVCFILLEQEILTGKEVSLCFKIKAVNWLVCYMSTERLNPTPTQTGYIVERNKQ